jgi:glycosyltransferase involved in cell wall biosynthesis
MPTIIHAPERRSAVPSPPEAVAPVLRGRDMLCFSHDWAGDPLSKTHLMRRLARDNRVLWVNSIGYRAPSVSSRDLRRAAAKVAAAAGPLREVEPNLFVLHPLVVPAYGSPVMRAVNRHLLRLQVRRAMRRLGFERPINWVFNPAAALVAGTLGEERIIYYCVDEYAALNGVPATSLVQLERELLERADVVIVSAARLLESKRRHNPRTHLVRHGVDFDHFRTALDPATPVPPEIAALPRPVIGYFGLIADEWVDVELLARVAEHFRSGSVVMLGKIAMDVRRLRALPNVHLLGRKPYGMLPAYAKGFDAALIPFPRNEATIHSNPLKAREYLAAGLPVVSTPVPEVEVLQECRIGHDHAGFVAEVEAAVADRGPRAERSDRMRDESWDARLADVSRLVLSAPTRGRRRSGSEGGTP